MNTKFFIGCDPSQARHFDSCMISVNRLRRRESGFLANDWLMDSGAFTEIVKFGGYRFSVAEYSYQIKRFSTCGNLLAAVAQDFMCEPFALKRTGKTVLEHQQMTVERFDELRKLVSDVYIMPVLQGFLVSDYLKHLEMYGSRLAQNDWVGVGSVCKRNANPQQIADILIGVKMLRPDLRIHGFGIKLTALSDSTVRKHLFSADSMAWSFRSDKSVTTARNYLARVRAALDGETFRTQSPTAGANNNQGRKSNWKNSPTVPIRVPLKFSLRLLSLARDWDEKE